MWDNPEFKIIRLILNLIRVNLATLQHYTYFINDCFNYHFSQIMPSNVTFPSVNTFCWLHFPIAILCNILNEPDQWSMITIFGTSLLWYALWCACSPHAKYMSLIMSQNGCVSVLAYFLDNSIDFRFRSNIMKGRTGATILFTIQHICHSFQFHLNISLYFRPFIEF